LGETVGAAAAAGTAGGAGSGAAAAVEGAGEGTGFTATGAGASTGFGVTGGVDVVGAGVAATGLTEVAAWDGGRFSDIGTSNSMSASPLIARNPLEVRTGLSSPVSITRNSVVLPFALSGAGGAGGACGAGAFLASMIVALWRATAGVGAGAGAGAGAFEAGGGSRSMKVNSPLLLAGAAGLAGGVAVNCGRKAVVPAGLVAAGISAT
jgi:hypothetical protein